MSRIDYHPILNCEGIPPVNPLEAANSRSGNSPHTYFFYRSKTTVSLLCNAPYQFLDASKLGQFSFLGSRMSPHFTWWHPTRLLIHRHTILTPTTTLKEQEKERSKAWPLQKAVPEWECSSASSHLALLRSCSQLWGPGLGHPICPCPTHVPWSSEGTEGLVILSSHRASCYSLPPPKCFHAT